MSNDLLRRCVKALATIYEHGGESAVNYGTHEAYEAAGSHCADLLDMDAELSAGFIARKVPLFVCDDRDLVMQAARELYGNQATRFVDSLEAFADEMATPSVPMPAARPVPPRVTVRPAARRHA